MKVNEIAQLLPDIFQRTLPSSQDTFGNVLMALLHVMEIQHAPVETTLEQLDRYFLPDQTCDRFVPFLAQWLDLAWLVEAQAKLDPGVLFNLRVLLQEAPNLSLQRGTRQGLLRFLHLATGLRGFQIEEAPDRAYHIVVTYPHQADPKLVAVIVDQLKPAYVTFELRGPKSQKPESPLPQE